MALDNESVNTLCKEGLKIASVYNDECFSVGQPTPLYYHIVACEQCAELRQQLREKLNKGTIVALLTIMVYLPDPGTEEEADNYDKRMAAAMSRIRSLVVDKVIFIGIGE